MTPYECRFLLHCYYSPEPYFGARLQSPAYIEWVNKMMKAGVVWPTRANTPAGSPDQTFDLTERGHAWVQAILSTPCPELE